jgi:hypothetical protein
MSVAFPDRDLCRRKRRLRLEMGRVRRRIDRRVRSSQRRARELLHWRTYARRYPGNATLGAFGLGLALSAGLGGRRVSRWLGLRLVRRALRDVGRRLGRELAEIWAESTPAGDHATTTDP